MGDISPWMNWVIGLSAFVVALGVLWKKVLRPGAGLITNIELMLPLLIELKNVFANSPQAFSVLNEIAAQFRTNAGSSLRDAINRLEKASSSLKVQADTAQQLSERDRQQMQRLEIMLDRLMVKSESVAQELTASQNAVRTVARDLAESHARADEAAGAAEKGQAGEAADAASQLSRTDRRILDDNLRR